MRTVQLKYGQLEKQRDVLNHWIQNVSLRNGTISCILS